MTKENDLLYAIELNDFNKVKHLIARNANLNQPAQLPTNMRTHQDEYLLPLNYAVYKNRSEMVRYLLEHGADVNGVTPKGYSSLLIAVDGNLFTYSYHSGYGSANKAIIQALLERGADVNVKGFDNRTPLYYSVVNTQNEIVPLLLNFGANPNIESNDSETPLYKAILRMRNYCQYPGEYLTPESFFAILIRSNELNQSPSHRESCVNLLYKSPTLANKDSLTTISNYYFYEALVRQDLPLISQILNDYQFYPSPGIFSAYIKQRNLDDAVLQASAQFIDKLANTRVMDINLAIELKSVMQNAGLSNQISPPCVVDTCVVDNSQQSALQTIQTLEQRCAELTREVEALKNILRQGNMNVVPEYNTPRMFKAG